MTMLYAHTHKADLHPEFYALLNRVMAVHLNEGLTGIMTVEGEYVILDEGEAQQKIANALERITTFMADPTQPFPYPTDFITADLLRAIQKLKLDIKKRERAASTPPKPKAQKDAKDTKAEKPSEKPSTKPDKGASESAQTPAPGMTEQTNEPPAA